MLTATPHRTNSATTTGLNLGTRTLAATANAVNVAIPLRSVLDRSHQHMRNQRHGMRDMHGPSITDCRTRIPGSPRCSVPFGMVPGIEVWAEWPPVVGDVVPSEPAGSRRPAAAKPAKAARPSTRPAARFAAGG